MPDTAECKQRDSLLGPAQQDDQELDGKSDLDIVPLPLLRQMQCIDQNSFRRNNGDWRPTILRPGSATWQ